MARANQIPSSDTIESLLAINGEIINDMSQSMDEFIWQLADMNRYNFFQFYDARRRMFLLGKDGMVQEDFDFDPSTMVPASLPNEPMISGDFISSRADRAKLHLRNFLTRITPSSLHDQTNTRRQLTLLQASKVNPVLADPQLMAETLNIPNWGKLEGDTVLERWTSWMNIQKELGMEQAFDMGKVQLMLQMLMMQMQMGMSPEGQMAQQLSGIAGALNGSGAGASNSGQVPAQPAVGGATRGRPPSFGEQASLKQRPDGSVTNTTS
jgi:hypothetical protein